MKSDSALKNQQDLWSLPGPKTDAFSDVFHTAVLTVKERVYIYIFSLFLFPSFLMQDTHLGEEIQK